MTVVAGVDGTIGGWVFVLLRDGRFEAARFHASFAAGIEAHAEATVFGVDIPIGLQERDFRAADREARTFLGPRASTIFLTPPRPAVEATTYPEASLLCRALAGQGLTRQAFALFPKILEVDAVADDRLYEVHPEVSFAHLAGGAPLASRKRTWAGAAERRALLAGAGIVLPDDLGPVGHAAGTDDVLDAAAAAWSAARIASGTAVAMPRDCETRTGAIRA